MHGGVAAGGPGDPLVEERWPQLEVRVADPVEAVSEREQLGPVAEAVRRDCAAVRGEARRVHPCDEAGAPAGRQGAPERAGARGHARGHRGGRSAPAAFHPAREHEAVAACEGYVDRRVAGQGPQPSNSAELEEDAQVQGCRGCREGPAGREIAAERGYGARASQQRAGPRCGDHTDPGSTGSYTSVQEEGQKRLQVRDRETQRPPVEKLK